MKKQTKTILLIIAIFVIAFIVVFASMLTTDLKQEEKLENELNSLYTLLNNYPLDYEALDKQMATITTKDDYAKVEKAAKDYSKDFVNYMKQFDTLLNNETIVNALNVENIKEDGPDFTKTKNTLSESKTSLDTILTNFSNYLTEEAAMSYVKDMELDDYYIDFYKKFTLGDNLAEMESARDEVINNLNNLKSLIESEEEGINFLAKNKGSWEIEDDQLLFSSESLSNQYNAIIAKIQELG